MDKEMKKRYEAPKAEVIRYEEPRAEVVSFQNTLGIENRSFH